MSCVGITAGNTFDCADRLKGGVNQRLILGNLANLNQFTMAGNVINALGMKSGEQCWAFDGFRDSLQPRSVFVPGTNVMGYDHQIDFLAYGVSGDDRFNLEALAYGDIFAVVENGDDSALGNAFFEVFGLDRGLEVITMERINADGETNGAYAIQLKTPDRGGKEDGLPKVWFDTDYDTTKTAVEVLLTPQP